MGETYERLLAGADKVTDPSHPLYIADDFIFHGKFEEEQYTMAGYFDDGSHALSLLGKKMISASRRLLTEAASRVRLASFVVTSDCHCENLSPCADKLLPFGVQWIPCMQSRLLALTCSTHPEHYFVLLC